MVDKDREVTELMKLLPDFVEAQIPFNKVLGMRVASLEMDSVCLKIEMKEELIGNPMRGIFYQPLKSLFFEIPDRSVIKNRNHNSCYISTP